MSGTRIVKPGHGRGSQFCDIGYEQDWGYELKEAVGAGSRKG
jgi:hypothetical protein